MNPLTILELGVGVVVVVIVSHFIYTFAKQGGAAAMAYLKSLWDKAKGVVGATKRELISLKGDVATLKSDMSAVKAHVGMPAPAPAPAPAPTPPAA